MTLKGEPLELRAHHVERLFYAQSDIPIVLWAFFTEMEGYTPEFAENLTAVCREIFEYNRPIKIINSVDALCAKCTGKKRENKCELQDPDFEIRGMKTVFGDDIEVGGTYTPLEMIERAIRYARSEIEKKEMLPENYLDNILLETQRQRLAGLESTYEKLMQTKGALR